jgi:hypothetical protein
MLHAVVQGKATTFLTKVSRDLRLPLEDVITSTVFGPLDLMSEDIAAAGLSQLLGLQELRLDRARLCFWPWLRSSAEYLHPDVVAISPQPRIELRLEIKWGAAFDPQQLFDQFRLDREEGVKVVQVAIVRDLGAALVKLRSFKGAEDWDPKLVSWREIAAYAFRGSLQDGPLRRWMTLVYKFLIAMDEVPFTGFGIPRLLLAQAGQNWLEFRIPRFFVFRRDHEN